MATPPSPVTVETANPARLLLIDRMQAGTALRDLVADIHDAPFQLTNEVESLSAATPILDRDEADLVLIGVGDEGVEAVSRLAHHPILGTYTPFIIVDETSREDVAMEAMRVGAQDYLALSSLTTACFDRSIRWAIQRSRELSALRRDNDLFAALMAHVPDRIYFKDAQSRFIRVSTYLARLHDFDDPNNLIGKTDFVFYPDEQARKTSQDEKRVMETGIPIVGKVASRTLPDGSEVWLSSTKLPLYDRRGRAVGTFGITRDITELKQLQIALATERNHLDESNRELMQAMENLQRAHDQLQEVQLQLIEAEKLESIGRLAAGVAHEVKNPLAVISLATEYLTARCGDDEKTAVVIGEIREAVNRADSVIKGLLDFSAPRKLELTNCDLNVIIRTALRLVRGEMHGELHRVELKLGEIPEISADRSKTCQVLVNLFTNALHAMAEGGSLTVESALRKGEGEGGRGDTVVVVIRDTGPGIPPAHLERIFDPFFTTKPSGKGSGLGMSVVRSIMKLLGGSVEIANGESGGAIVTLTFKVKNLP